MKLVSSLYGEFDPLSPKKVSGLFAFNLQAKPVDIEAPINAVWEIMTDFDQYSDWNHCNRYFDLDGSAEPGQVVTFGPSWGPFDIDSGVLPENDFVQREIITVWQEPFCLSYPVVGTTLDAERTQYLECLADGKTRYHTYERMRGLQTPVILMMFRKKMLSGFAANAAALKRRAESA